MEMKPHAMLLSILVLTLAAFVNACTSSPVVTNSCVWLNQVMPITVSKDERDAKLSYATLAQIHNANYEWQRHCVTNS